MQLNTRIYGNEGPWIVIVHGLYGSGDNWTTLARQLSAHYRVLVPDLRNHGASPHAPQHTYSDMRQDLLETMLHYGIEKAHLIGHSMGGKVVMHLAIAHQEMVNTLVVVDIAPKSYVNGIQPEQQGNQHFSILDTLRQLPIKECSTRQQIEDLLAEKISDLALRQFLLKNIKRNASHGFEWKINVDVLWEYLPEIIDGFSNQTLPVYPNRCLFIKGEHSGYITDDDFFTTRKLFPKAEFVTIPNAGHWVNAEQPELLIKTIRYFLE